MGDLDSTLGPRRSSTAWYTTTAWARRSPRRAILGARRAPLGRPLPEFTFADARVPWLAGTLGAEVVVVHLDVRRQHRGAARRRRPSGGRHAAPPGARAGRAGVVAAGGARDPGLRHPALGAHAPCTNCPGPCGRCTPWTGPGVRALWARGG
ncbi:MAG: hypothetical protein V9G29_15840 [Burkholderiaceae bacterium]